MTTYENASDITRSRAIFLQGIRNAAPFALVVGPFGLLFGVVASETGLNIVEAFTYSVAVIAGAAQLTGMQLLQHGAPLIIALVSALAVNLRMAMYSAALTPYLGHAPLWKRAVVAYLTVDQTYACSVLAFEKNPEWSVSQRLSFFMGTVVPICPVWALTTVAGFFVGSSVPPWLALDFALPITFIAMVAPMLRSLAHVAACATSIVLALLLAWLPFNAGLLISAIVGMMAGARVEVLMERRA